MDRSDQYCDTVSLNDPPVLWCHQFTHKGAREEDGEEAFGVFVGDGEGVPPS